MRTYLLGVVLIGLLSSGCSSDWDPGRDGTGVASIGSDEPDTSLPVVALASRAGPTGFASLPDRGELLRYDDDRTVVRRSAYTLHPIELSEEHALNSIATGQMKVRTPDGKAVSIDFESLDEHPDGNWSWVGQNKTGEHAVLTFGERAVFGEVFVSGRSYRVTMRDGSAWIVETDRSPIASRERGQADGTPDFLLPPEGASLPSAQTGIAGAKTSAARASTVPGKLSSFVDVVVGYSSGMVAAYGNQATAITRINNLVTLTNSAYQRSGVTMRLRLVGAIQVNYADNNDNTDTLQKLTGYNSSTQQFVTPDAAFTELRAAREQYGADLVALVRPYRAPEQNGCGIAWLIGANGRAITGADERFGYSVISDGADADEGNGQDYFCSEYSFAHELGHSMGQAHNQEDAPNPGAHPYSYGFREASSNGFFTIMAYPLSNGSQQEAPYFATPLINFAAGRPLGLAGVADNVRSLNEVMPVISTFRASKVIEQLEPLVDAKRQDINGDGRADLMWFLNEPVSYFAYWTMSGASKTGGNSYVIGAGWNMVASGDFRGDQRLDLVWTDGISMQMWEGNGTSFTGSAMRGYPAGYRIVGVGDINGDNRSDLIWRDNANTQVATWIMNGPDIIGSASYAVPPTWRVLGTGDFNADGRLDLLWTDGVVMQLWLGNANGFTGIATPNYPSGWQLFGVGDFNGDGRSDLFWRYPGTGEVAVWTMSGGSRLAGYGFPASAAWRPVQVADFTGDGRADIFWTDGASTQVWVAQGTGFVGQSGAAYPSGWTTVNR